MASRPAASDSAERLILLRPFGAGRYPLFFRPVAAGFPSPADDHIEKLIDLNEQLIDNPVATFFHRIVGDGWERIGLSDGDRLIVDRSAEPAEGAYVVADVEGARGLYHVKLERGVKRLYDVEGRPVEAEAESVIWGTVTYAIRRMRA